VEFGSSRWIDAREAVLEWKRDGLAPVLYIRTHGATAGGSSAIKA